MRVQMTCLMTNTCPAAERQHGCTSFLPACLSLPQYCPHNYPFGHTLSVLENVAGIELGASSRQSEQRQHQIRNRRSVQGGEDQTRHAHK